MAHRNKFPYDRQPSKALKFDRRPSRTSRINRLLSKSKNKNRQPSQLPTPPFHSSSSNSVNSVQLNNDPQSQWHLFFLTNCFYQILFETTWNDVPWKKNILTFSLFTHNFAKMDITYFHFAFSFPDSIYYSLCKMPPSSFWWHYQRFFSFHLTGTRLEVECHAQRLLMPAG